MANVYEWKIKGFYKADAQKAGEFIASIEQKHGAIDPHVLVEESRSKKAPTHKCFTWDDTEAAEKFREGQARSLIKNIKVKFCQKSGEEEESKVAFYSIKKAEGYTRDRKGKVYISAAKAQENPDYMEEILRDALSDMISFRRRYSEIKELSDVLESIDRAQLSIEAALSQEASA